MTEQEIKAELATLFGQCMKDVESSAFVVKLSWVMKNKFYAAKMLYLLEQWSDLA